MKELILSKKGLTTEPQTPYSKGGGIFMGEPGQGENKKGKEDKLETVIIE